MINFVFMLTHHDATVTNALEVVQQLRGSELKYIGFKDVGMGPEQLAEITAASHEQGLEVMLEVVSTRVSDERRSLESAREIDVDWVLGGTNPTIGTDVLAGTDIRYCPFPGTVIGHPSTLEGTVEEISRDAARLTNDPDIFGVDLLAYRHKTADVEALTRAVVEATVGPVIVAGSITAADQIGTLERAGAWGFTIGGAIFEGQLSAEPTIIDQVEAVLAMANTKDR